MAKPKSFDDPTVVIRRCNARLRSDRLPDKTDMVYLWNSGYKEEYEHCLEQIKSYGKDPSHDIVPLTITTAQATGVEDEEQIEIEHVPESDMRKSEWTNNADGTPAWLGNLKRKANQTVAKPAKRARMSEFNEDLIDVIDPGDEEDEVIESEVPPKNVTPKSKAITRAIGFTIVRQHEALAGKYGCKVLEKNFYNPFDDNKMWPVGWVKNEWGGLEPRMVGAKIARDGSIKYKPVNMIRNFYILDDERSQLYLNGRSWSGYTKMDWPTAVGKIKFSAHVWGDNTIPPTDIPLRNFIFQQGGKEWRMKTGWNSGAESSAKPWIRGMYEMMRNGHGMVWPADLTATQGAACIGQIIEPIEEFARKCDEAHQLFHRQAQSVRNGAETHDLTRAVTTCLETIDTEWRKVSLTMALSVLDPKLEWLSQHETDLLEIGIQTLIRRENGAKVVKHTVIDEDRAKPNKMQRVWREEATEETQGGKDHWY